MTMTTTTTTTTATTTTTGSVTPREALVIDRDERFTLALCHCLERSGWRARALRDPREALRALTEGAPTVLVMDLDGEDLDGFELLAALRRLPDRPRVLVCARQQAATTFGPALLERLGIDRVLPRPCAFERLVTEIGALEPATAAAPEAPQEVAA